jgi:hypothetical protein
MRWRDPLVWQPGSKLTPKTPDLLALLRTVDFKTYRNPIWPGRSWPFSMKEINPAEGTESVTVDLELDPGLSVKIRVVDPEGKPVSGASVTGGHSRGPTKTTQDDEIQLANFRPDEQRNVIVRHEARKVAKVIRIGPGADKDGPFVVTLAPLATIRGRTVDADGNPVPASRVRPDLQPGGDFGLKLGQVVSDKEGRFMVQDVPTGCDYSLCVEAGTMMKEHRVAFKDAKVKPGETTDIGDVRFKND